GGGRCGGRAGRLLQAERLRPLRHDRQCLGVDERLVSGGSPTGGSGQSERTRIAGSGADRRPVAKPRHQGRLFPVRFQLLRPLSTGRAPTAGSGPRHRASWVSNDFEPSRRGGTLVAVAVLTVAATPD